MNDTAPQRATEIPAPHVDSGVPLIDRPRPSRPPLIPSWVPISAVALVVAAVLAVAIAMVLAGRATEVVPRVVGIDSGVARTRLAQQGLELSITEERFSALTAGTVIEQRPAPGAELTRGEPVAVVVSGGSEDFSMPDLVGTGLAYARGQLEAKGLEVRILAEPSEQTSDTVIATNPASGSSMRTGDIVMITVAAAGVGDSVLLPSSLQGVVVILDPAPAPAGRTDIPLDVARRVRSLLEASGATVFSTRALADTGTAVTEDTRRKRALEESASVGIGLDVQLQGKAGTVVLAPGTGTVAVSSTKLASEIASALVSSGLRATKSTRSADKVLGGTSAPFARLQLGSFGAREDVARFNDPGWADRVARAVYRAVAGAYGRKEPTP